MQPSLESIADAVLRKEDVEGFAALSAPEKVIATVWELEAQVNNGGFDQFFFNSQADIILSAERALREIAANRCAGITKRALAIFGESGPQTDLKKRRDQLLSFGDETEALLEKLDAEFYAYPDDLEALLLKFAVAHGLGA